MLHRVGAAVAEVLVAGDGADSRVQAPAAVAFLARRRLDEDADARHLRQLEALSWPVTELQRARRGDEDLRQVDALEGRRVIRRGEDPRRRLQAGADALLRALALPRAGDDTAELADALPLGAQPVVAPLGWHLGIGDEMDAHLVAITMAAEPSFLGGEAEHRRQPARQAIEDAVENRAHGAAARRI